MFNNETMNWLQISKQLQSPNCPKEFFYEIYETSDENETRKKGYYIDIAKNTNCPSDLLDKLAKYNDKYVKSNVASNPNTSEDTLLKLSEDKDEWVRSNVAMNKNVSVEILRKLANDNKDDVLCHILKNKNCTDDIIVHIYNRIKNSLDYINKDYKSFNNAKYLIEERNIDISKFSDTREIITTDIIIELKDIVEETRILMTEIDFIEFGNSEYEHLIIYTKPTSSIGRIKLIELVPDVIDDTIIYKYIMNIEKNETDLIFRKVIKLKDDLIIALNQTIPLIRETPLLHRCIYDINYIIDNI